MTLPKYLYHYTSQNGLLGILQTNKLWMTNILYLNDSSEFKHTLDLVKTELKNRYKNFFNTVSNMDGYLVDPSSIDISLIPKWETMSLERRKYEVYKELISYFDSHHFGISDSIYVFSLSTKEDDLNQWRGYCPKEGGFCIEFETKKISSIVKKTNRSLIKCVYTEKEKNKIVKSLFDNLEFLFDLNKKTRFLLDDFKTHMKNQNLIDKNIIGFYHHTEIIDISSYLKDESLKNEMEYRIVQKSGPIEMNHRQGNSMIIPYIEGNLSENDKLPISKIIVGPTPHPELSMMSVDSLLKYKGYKGVKVKKSNIPYRSW